MSEKTGAVSMPSQSRSQALPKPTVASLHLYTRDGDVQAYEDLLKKTHRIMEILICTDVNPLSIFEHY